MFANMQSEKFENIVLNNFRSTDTTNATGIKQHFFFNFDNKKKN